MPKQTIQVASPIRGVDRSKGREAQPDSSVFDALNVLPYDRTNRIRIGQRAGMATLIDTGTGAAVKGLYQVVLSQIDASSGGTREFLWTEDLSTLSNGDITGQNGWVADQASDIGWTMSVVSGGLLPDATTDFFSGNKHLLNAATNQSVSTPTEAFRIQDDWTCFFRIVPKSTINPAPNDRFTTLRIGNAGGDEITLTYTETSANVGSFQLTWPGNSHTVTGVTVTQNSERIFAIGYTASTTTLEILLDSVSLYSTSIAGSLPSETSPRVEMIGAGVIVHSLEIDSTFTSPVVESRPRDVRLIATSNTNLYMGTLAGFTSTHTSVLALNKPMLTDFDGHVYVVDGTNTLDYDVAGDSIGALTASAGSVPVGCFVARVYRGRLVLAAATADQQNYFVSRVGDPTDWDFSQTDAAAAFAGNDTQNGRINDIIVDMVPWTNDLMAIFGDHSIFIMRGDPADNGSVDLVSTSLGMIGRNAWTIAPDGTLYFIGTGGFYRWSAGASQPEPISALKYDQFFTDMNRKEQYYDLQWDRDHHGCLIHVTEINTGTSTHLWYDLRTDSFWPLQYPDIAGPMSALVYDGDSPTDRTLLIGGRDGIVRQITNTNRHDDGNAISSYIILGPFKPFAGAGVLTSTQVNFGELTAGDQADDPTRWGVDITLMGGPDAYSVTEGTPHSKAAIHSDLGRRQKFLRQRIRGGWFGVKLSNSEGGTYWAMESIAMEFEDGGKLREIR